MPDITMCEGKNKTQDCPMRENCYRYTAEPSQFRQSYFYGVPVMFYQDKAKCDYFWDNKVGK